MLPTGETGEVCARAGNFMTEYWNKPEATATFRDGWYHSGDAGYLDERGYLYLVDRVKDMIVTGGENVYSVEVETRSHRTRRLCRSRSSASRRRSGAKLCTRSWWCTEEAR